MSPFWVGNIYLLLSILCVSASQIVLKIVVSEMGPLGLSWSSVQSFFCWGKFLRASAAALLVVGGFLFWILTLSKLDVSYAYAVACSSALLVTLLSVLFLNETVSVRMWFGTVLIVAGTALLAPAG